MDSPKKDYAPRPGGVFYNMELHEASDVQGGGETSSSAPCGAPPGCTSSSYQGPHSGPMMQMGHSSEGYSHSQPPSSMMMGYMLPLTPEMNELNHINHQHNHFYSPISRYSPLISTFFTVTRASKAVNEIPIIVGEVARL